MQFTRTNINKTFRNGVVNASNVAVTNVGGGSSSLSGNFLPAVNNGDGSYTVDLSSRHEKKMLQKSLKHP